MNFQAIRTKNSSIHADRTLDTLEKDLIRFQDPNITLQNEYDVLFQIISRCRALRISPQELLTVRQEVFETVNAPEEKVKAKPVYIENKIITEVKQVINHCANPACNKPAKEGSKYCDSKSSSCRVAVSKLTKS